MNIPHALAEVIAKPAPPPPGGYIDDLPEAFGALDENGDVFIIGYKGEWFHILKPSLRVRLHNWLIRVGERWNPNANHD